MIIKASPEYIELLNQAVAREIQVAVQYMIQHTKMEKLLSKHIPENILMDKTVYDNFGEVLKNSAIDEMKHLATIMERIYVLGGEATTKPTKIKIGDSLREMAKLDYEAEVEALELYRKIINKARENGDKETRLIFNKIYSDEEKHLLVFEDYDSMPDEPAFPEPPKSKWTKIFDDDEYISMLNSAVAAELSAIVQYTNQHEKASSAEFRKKKTALELVADKTKASVISGLLKPIFMQEMDHFEKISERIFEIQKEVIADVNPLPKIGKDPDEWVKLDRAGEDYAIVLYRKIIKKATELGDIKTKKMFEDILLEEEEHYWTFDDYV
ncbi:MAG: ferritin-like domain-containing protein [Promethearchaeota archaeon]